MTELGAEAWEGYGRIEWSRLARAHAFFLAKGYAYIEVPWAVPQSIVDATIPPGATPIAVRGADAVLVGSAEQGFLQIVESQKGRLSSGGLFFSISPCFRGEPRIIRGHTQLCFMKLELFAPSTSSLQARSSYRVEDAAQFMMDDAEQFMTTEGAHLTRVRTEAGFDLECDGVEVGSYGTREFNDTHWAYATGLAEPRFSLALRSQQDRRMSWDDKR